MKLIIGGLFFFFFFLFALEEKVVNIPAKSKTITMQKTIPNEETVLGVSPEEIKKCEETDKYSPIAFFWSGTLVVSVGVLLLFILLVIKAKLMLNEAVLVKKFGKLVAPLKESVAQKNQEIAILRSELSAKGDADSLLEEVKSLSKTIDEKNKIINQLTTQISILSDNPKSIQSSVDTASTEIIENQRKEIELISKEKLEFLEMIENLQKQIVQNKEAESFRENTLSQNALDDLISTSGYVAPPKQERPERDYASEAMLEEVMSGKSGGVSGGSVISQEDLDALISGVVKEAPVKKEEPISLESGLSQSDLDILMAGLNSKPAEAPLPKEPPKGDLSQEDLDALFK